MDTRYTIYAVSAKVTDYHQSDGIPWVHTHSEETARQRAVMLMVEGKTSPTRIVERKRAYPFEMVRMVWTCADGTPPVGGII